VLAAASSFLLFKHDGTTRRSSQDQVSAHKKTRPQSRVFNLLTQISASALTGFHTGILFVDHVNATMPTHHTAIFVANFRGFQRVTDLHHTLTKLKGQSGAVCRPPPRLSTLAA
jgi:hypothetical protein